VLCYGRGFKKLYKRDASTGAVEGGGREWDEDVRAFGGVRHCPQDGRRVLEELLLVHDGDPRLEAPEPAALRNGARRNDASESPADHQHLQRTMYTTQCMCLNRDLLLLCSAQGLKST
jgi:hypothetical protein